MKLTITKNEAVNLAINAQFPKLTDEDDIYPIIKHLSYIQIDTLSVVHRSHNHVLWTRFPRYEEEMLLKLLSESRKVFEYWAHAMAYLPMEDYKFYLVKMNNFKNPNNKWFLEKLKQSDGMVDVVLERIKKEGPLSSKDFNNKKQKKASWWDWKPAKAALEILFWRGDLMVTERKNFQKVYDLAERVLPENIDTNIPGEAERAQFIIERALKVFGIASPKEIQKFLQPGSSRDSEMSMVSPDKLKKELQKMVESDIIFEINIENLSSKYYALADNFETLAALVPDDTVHILSPFDNLVIQRERVAKLFNFNYIIECYLPEAKRKYGYFVMPVLWRNKFVARFDPKADRKTKVLIIKNLVFESNVEKMDLFIPMLAKKLKEFCIYNGCKKIKFEKVTPAKFKQPFIKLLRDSILTGSKLNV